MCRFSLLFLLLHYSNYTIRLILYLILNNDEPQYDIFDKEFHKKYFNIVKKSKQLII